MIRFFVFRLFLLSFSLLYFALFLFYFYFTLFCFILLCFILLYFALLYFALFLLLYFAFFFFVLFFVFCFYFVFFLPILRFFVLLCFCFCLSVPFKINPTINVCLSTYAFNTLAKPLVYILSSSGRAASTGLLDPLPPPVSIVHRSWSVFKDTSGIGTELLYISSSWSSCLCSSMWRDPQEYVAYEFVPTSPAVYRISGSSILDSFYDGW